MTNKIRVGAIITIAFLIGTLTTDTMANAAPPNGNPGQPFQQILDELVVIFQDMTDIGNDVDMVQNDVVLIKNDLGTLGNDQSNLQSDVTMIKDDLGTLQSDVTMIKDDLGTLQSDVTMIKDDLGTLQSDVTMIKDDLDTISDGQAAIQSQLDSISEPMTQVSNFRNTLTSPGDQVSNIWEFQSTGPMILEVCVSAGNDWDNVLAGIFNSDGHLLTAINKEQSCVTTGAPAGESVFLETVSDNGDQAFNYVFSRTTPSATLTIT